MKKLMIAAAIVCAAAFTQAATATWTVTNVKTSDGSTANANIGYLFALDRAETYDYSAATICNYIKALGTQEAISSFLDEESATTFTPTTAGTYSRPTASKIDVAELGLTSGNYYDCFWVFVDTDKTSGDILAVAVSKQLENKMCPTGSNNLSLNFSTQADYTASGKWVAVPEPTSGLLLLLGVAGLALRRRRA